MTKIAVVGAGSWGTALAVVAARAGHNVTLWSRNPGVVDSINTHRTNSSYLSSTQIPRNVLATNRLVESVSDSALVLIATPSHAVRNLLPHLQPVLPEASIIVSLTKGIEINSGMRISEVVRDVLGSARRDRFVCLSGPSFAKEVVDYHPTAIVAASTDESIAATVQAELSYGNLRIYTNTDVIGTELGGSVKNVMAIAAGMTAGLGYGSNTVAALITRGLAEMTRLTLSQGGRLETLMGLAGLGDLVLTCTGALSRNRFVGEELGRGKSIEQITSAMTEVAEGIKTSRAVKRLAEKVGIEMPITNQVEAVIHGGKSAREAVEELMRRPLRSEVNF